MSEEFDALVWRCLEEVERGVALEVVLSRYPQDAAELRPILQVAAGLHALAAAPDPRTQAAAQEHFLIHASALRQVVRPRTVWTRRLGLALASMLVLLVAVFGLVQGSAEAVPGDALYPVKRARENVQLALTSDPTTVSALQHSFNDERVAEIKTLLTIGRDEEIECEANIEAVGDGVIEVYGVDLRLTDATTINGVLQVGRTIKMTGYTADGRLFATKIEVEDEDEDETRDDSAAPLPIPPTADIPVLTPSPFTPAPGATQENDSADDDAHTPAAPTRDGADRDDDSDEIDDDHRATSAPVTPTPGAPSNDSGSDSDHSDEDNSGSDGDNSGSDSDNSGEDDSGSGGEDAGDDDNSGSGSDNSNDDDSDSGGEDAGDDDNSDSGSHDIDYDD